MADPHPTPPRAVLWDLDGVLVDTEALLLKAEQIAFAAHGAEVTAEFKRSFVGMGGTEVLAAMAEALGLEVDLDDLARRKLDAYAAQLPHLESFPATGAVVRALSAAGMPQAVASGSTPEGIRAALHLAGLDQILTTQVSVADVGWGKPAPDVFLEAARRLGVDPADCLVVEDAVPGVLAATAAGMRCVAIPSVTDPLDERFERADLLVRGGMAEADPEAIVAWILGQSDCVRSSS